MSSPYSIVITRNIDQAAVLIYYLEKLEGFKPKTLPFSRYEIRNADGSLHDNLNKTLALQICNLKDEKFFYIYTLDNPEFDKMMDLQELENPVYDSIEEYLENEARQLTELDPSWDWDFESSGPVDDKVLVNGKSYVTYLNMSAEWPDSFCRRVNINDVNYYFE